jgi:hypothetical protein
MGSERSGPTPEQIDLARIKQIARRQVEALNKLVPDRKDADAIERNRDAITEIRRKRTEQIRKGEPPRNPQDN